MDDKIIKCLYKLCIYICSRATSLVYRAKCIVVTG